MSGSAVIDVVLLLVILASVAAGWRQGGSVAGFSLVGVLAGGFVGVRAIPVVLRLVDRASGGDGAEADAGEGWRFLLALGVILGFVLVGYALGSAIGVRLRQRLRTTSAAGVDSLLGSIVHVVTTLVVVWLVLAPVAARDSNHFSQSLKGSAVLSGVERATPQFIRNVPARVHSFIDASGFPVISDPFNQMPQRQVDAPNPALSADPVVAAVGPSVVHVIAEADQCSRLLQGSGFVVAPNTVMTNAHVVAGTNKVQLSTVNGRVDATVTMYNPQHDIALLSAPGLGLQPLQWSEADAQAGQDAIVLGYPLGGPFTATPARVREKFVVSGPNIYANSRVDREAYSLRATVQHGNSGGPLVDGEGQVLGLIFGADANEDGTGYALTREEVDSQVGQLSQYRAAVGTGACVNG
ncbi:MarP family serine protease [Corynebacterium heidelbergense]|uniref:Serine protease n=1 Tax=Corynebacterium heidelbergense TaxID=2055947 RepID=A0A364V4G4_9CORY|nr:MarP family serine protease [Corynebacterium heidelbergense]RAV31534.1 serine protease [Corynebacterium heidelbergense]